MACYYIDTSDGEFTLVDVEGLDLPSDAAARLMALRALPEMVRAKSHMGDNMTFVVRVRAPSGRVVYTASLVVEGRWQSQDTTEALDARAFR